MIDIIPNWHPLLVHFTVGLIMVSVVMHVIVLLLPRTNSIRPNMITVANWNLWIGAVITLFTAAAGWFAYQSVKHDTPSHLAMTDHRNWAIATTVAILVTALWSLQRARHQKGQNYLIVAMMIVVGGLLVTTGWKGGELVYRYGLGVMALPKTDTHDHAAHDHGDAGHDSQPHGHSNPTHDVDNDNHTAAQSEPMQSQEPIQENVQPSLQLQNNPTQKKPAAPANKPHKHTHDHADHVH